MRRVVIILASFVALVLGFLAYMGVFHGVQIKESEFSALKSGLQFRTLPRQNYISTEFPYRNMISIYIGLSKA